MKGGVGFSFSNRAALSQRFGVDSRPAEHSRTEPWALARGPALDRRESVRLLRRGPRALTGTALFGARLLCGVVSAGGSRPNGSGSHTPPVSTNEPQFTLMAICVSTRGGHVGVS